MRRRPNQPNGERPKSKLLRPLYGFMLVILLVLWFWLWHPAVSSVLG